MQIVQGEGGETKPRAIRTSFVINPYWHDWVEEISERMGISKSQIYLTALSEYRDRMEGKAVDAWDTADDDPGYDPHHFYTHSQDKKGHSFHARVNLPKPLAGAIGALVQSGRIPQYRTTEDVIRDATYHRVKQIAHAIDDGELEEAVDMAMLLADELQMIAKEDEAESLLAAMRSNIERMWARGERAALRRYLAEREALVDSIPAPWSDELDGLIKAYRKKLQKGRRRG